MCQCILLTALNLIWLGSDCCGVIDAAGVKLSVSAAKWASVVCAQYKHKIILLYTVIYNLRYQHISVFNRAFLRFWDNNLWSSLTSYEY
jgi:hypothetical protein